MAGADHAGDRARFHHRYRLGARLIQRHGATVGAHDLHLAGKFSCLQMPVQPVQVIAHPGANIGIERGRRHALILTIFAQDIRGLGHENIRAGRRQNFSGALLVGRVGVGMQKTDGDGFDAVFGQLPGQGLHRVHVQRRQHFALGIQPLGHLERQMPGNQRLRPGEFQIEAFRPVGAANGVNIAKAFGGEERGAGALPFQHRIDGDGGAVQKHFNGAQIGARVFQTIGDPLGRIVDHGGSFAGDDLPIPQPHQIRKCATDIDAD